MKKTPAASSTAESRLCKQLVVGKQNQVLLQFITYNFSKAENPRKFAAANTPTASASVTVISLSFSYNAARARAKAEKGFFCQKVIKLTVSYAVVWDGRPILMPGPNLIAQMFQNCALSGRSRSLTETCRLVSLYERILTVN